MDTQGRICCDDRTSREVDSLAHQIASHTPCFAIKALANALDRLAATLSGSIDQSDRRIALRQGISHLRGLGHGGKTVVHESCDVILKDKEVLLTSHLRCSSLLWEEAGRSKVRGPLPPTKNKQRHAQCHYEERCSS